MKKVCFLLFLLYTQIGWAQTIPQQGRLYSIVPYSLLVSDKTTTVVIFPFKITEADFGSEQVSGMKMSTVENVLKLKAAGPMDTTSLAVATSDGKLHIFQLCYQPLARIEAYDLQFPPRPSPDTLTTLRFTDGLHNEAVLQSALTQLRAKRPFMYHGTRRFDLTLSIRGVYHQDDYQFLHFQLKNKEGLPFTPTWMRLYIKDRKTGKRTSRQEQTITPFWCDTLRQLDGNSTLHWYMVIPRTTVANKKLLLIEFQDQAGARTIALRLKNRQLLKSKQL